jgi:GTPase
VLLHLVSAREGDVAKAWKTVRKELKLYGAGLADKPEILALSQADTVTQEELDAKRKALKKAAKREPFILSSAARQGLEPLLGALAREIDGGTGD